MPGLDYKNEVLPSTGTFARPLHERPGPFYDGSPGRELAKCPDCGRDADAQFGDHGGDCIELARFPTPNSALGIVRAAALKHRRFSMNDVRTQFDKAKVAPTSRGPAFGQAVRRGWLEVDGSIRSFDPATKGHRIHTYRSLIHPEHVRELLAARHGEPFPKGKL